MARPLTPEQQEEADWLEARLLELARGDLRELAELLGSKSDRQPLGAAEFKVLDRVYRIGARALEVALAERQGGYLGSSLSCPG